jgi:hypothetical protein
VEGSRRAPTVHPHTRGEHWMIPAKVMIVDGSSPRSWGTSDSHRCAWACCTVHPHGSWGHVTCPIQSDGDVRFIPTLVGNTATRPGPLCWPPVQPHLRGEHVSTASPARMNSGSSPRPWGTRPRRWSTNRRSRFIPTLVGTRPCRRATDWCARFIPTLMENTSRLHSTGSSSTVHPHARGEHAFGLIFLDLDNGSSPRTWGTQQA